MSSPAGAAAPERRAPNRAGRPTADELERRKLKVMQAATDMFVTRGYAGTTLLNIAREAGVATRTLYQHFGDKEALFREVIFARDTAAIAPPAVDDGDDLTSALMTTGVYALEMSLRSQSIALMRLMIAESARFPDLMREVTNIIFSRLKGNVADVFRQLAARGLIPDEGHDRSAELFVDLMLGHAPVMIYFGWRSIRPTEEDVADKVALFIKGRFDIGTGARATASGQHVAGVAPLHAAAPAHGSA